ncbi:MAG: ATP-dependent carboxylate-amine ligase [Proteobacteria bacterium]|nr:ATP-dependent carboxylate-amine ligase [Pseudomonadota bacterium]
MNGRVLITGARAPAALDLARSFANAGRETHLADSTPCLMAHASRTPHAVHAYAPPAADPVQFKRDLERLIAGIQPSLIVPACEEVFHLAALARTWPDLRRRLFAPEFDTLAILHSKRRFVEACQTLGLRAPATWPIDTPNDLEAQLPHAQDRVFKREFSRFGDAVLVGPEPETARRQVTIGDASPWIAQQRLRGREASFYAVCREGRLTAFCAYASDWRDRGGASYVFEPVEPTVEAALAASADTLARALVRNGQFACDAIVDDAGVPWLIECNPRATSGAHLFDRRAGLARAMVTAGAMLTPPDSRVRYLGPALWLIALPDALAKGRMAAWRAVRREGVEVVGAPGDRRPRLGAVLDSLTFGARALVSGRSLTQAMTDGIAWDGHALPGAAP